MKGKFQYDLSEYLLVVSPSNRVNWEVEDIKLELAGNYGPYRGVKSKPHISLLNLVLHKTQEQEIVDRLKKKAASLESFDVVLDGFDFFDESNTLYVNIASGAIALTSLHNYLTADIQIKELMVGQVNRSFSPHLTIGRRLTDAQFRNAYHEFKNKSYANYFRVDSISLLKRKGPAADWTYLMEIPLKVEEGCVV
ncbi:MAG: 2'-5' RNA ligase family protein [Roseivirga sp.]|nr:2'-5' RNA ligase family protein [Roseivirga sp.]